MKFHFCEETPCPREIREVMDLLDAGMNTLYTKPMIADAGDKICRDAIYQPHPIIEERTEERFEKK